MESTQQSDRETYRAIVLGQGGNELLLSPAGDGFLLPSVEIPRWQRVAENMTVAIRSEWGQEAICLFNLDVSAPVTSANDHQLPSHGMLRASTDPTHVPSGFLCRRCPSEPSSIPQIRLQCRGLWLNVTDVRVLSRQDRSQDSAGSESCSDGSKK